MSSGQRVSVAIGFGAAAWVVCGVLSAAFDPQRTLGQALFFDLSTADWLMRVAVLLLFLLFGIVSGRWPGRGAPGVAREVRHGEPETSYLEIAGVMFVALDRDGCIMLANRKTGRVLGYEPEEIIGLNWFDRFVPDRECERLKVFFDQLMAGDIAMAEHVENAVVTRGGQERIIAWHNTVLRDESGRIIGTLSSGEDVTDQRQLEGQLRQAQKMEAVGTLAAGIAHDFNNLLTAIYGYTELAKATLPDGHAAIEALDMVERAAQQASGVTRSLLTFSRKGSAHKQPFDLVPSLQESVRLLRHVLPASIELADDVPADRVVCINGDAMQLQQVLMNLAVNARDAMPDGGRLAITMRTEETPAPGQAVLVVEDTGTGMTAETRMRIFEPFYTTKPRGKGTGLGMAIIHGIVTDHQGTIEVASQPGQGTRLEVRLPCCDAVPEAGSRPPDRARLPGRGERILVVDDDAHIRAIVTSSLRSLGYDVIQAVDGVEAMELVEAQGDRIQLIVLDLDLPRKSGESCLKAIRSQGPNVPVIITSGSVPPVLGTTGAHELRKPYQMFDLAALVSRVLAEPPVRVEGGG